MALLEVENLRAGYGSVPVLHGVSLNVDEGSNAVLLGLNGAGKSTTLMTLAGLLPVTGGEIRYDGKPLTGSPGARVRAGIVLVPEGRHVFPTLTVKTTCASAPGRAAATPAGSARTCWRSTRSSPASPTAPPRRPAPSPAASSRCSPSAAA